MYTIIINLKGGHEFEREWREIYRMVWMDKREWANDVTICSSFK